MDYLPTIQPNISASLQKQREEALARGIPVADDDTLQFLLVTLLIKRPLRILEIGTAVGLSGIAMLQTCPQARLTTIELEEERYLEAKQNFA